MTHFDLAGSRDNGLATLQRCYEHLHDGGALLLNIQAEYASGCITGTVVARKWRLFATTLAREGFPRRCGRQRDDYLLPQSSNLDPLEQTYTVQVRLEKWVTGERVATEEYTLCGNMYSKNELLFVRLQFAGFCRHYRIWRLL